MRSARGSSSIIPAPVIAQPPSSVPGNTHATSRPAPSVPVPTLLFTAGLLMLASAALEVRQARAPPLLHISEADDPGRQLALRAIDDTKSFGPTCRFTFLRPDFAVDDRGYACKLENIVALQRSGGAKLLGCCDTSPVGTTRYSCDSCEPSSSCCSSYSRCVSCCMSPTMRPVVKAGAEQAKALRALLKAKDLYEVCLATCRTNSKSVEHENAYKHRRHHCFGQDHAPAGRGGESRLFDFVRPLRRK